MTVEDIREIVAEPDGVKAAALWRKTKQPERSALYVRGLERFLTLPAAPMLEALGADMPDGEMALMLDKLVERVAA
jgi:hypothetical protein